MIKKKLRVIKFLVSSVVILFFIFTIRKVGIHLIFTEIRSLSMRTVLLAAVLYFLAFIINNVRWYLLIRDKTKKNFFVQIPVYMSGVLGNVLTPGARVGGEIIKVYYMEKIFGGTKSEHFGYILLDKLGNGLTFFGILSLTLWYGAGLLFDFYRSSGIFAGILIISVYVIYRITHYSSQQIKRKKILGMIYHFPLFPFIRKKFEDADVFEQYVLHKILTILHPLKTARRRDVFVIIVFSILSWGTVCFSNWLIYRAFVPEVSYRSVFIIVTLSTVISDISFTPGGAGFMETAMLMLSASFGITSGSASSAVLINRGIFYFIALILSSILTVPLLLIYGKRGRIENYFSSRE